MGRDTTHESYDIFDDDEGQFSDEDGGELVDLCGLAPNGQCAQAGTEHCDFECPNRNSEWFAGSAAWEEKRKRKSK